MPLGPTSALRPAIRPLKPDAIHVGDFVHCRSSRYREQLQLPEELALVIEIKRANFKVLYSNDKRAWLPREYIVRMQPQDHAAPSLLQKLHYILKRVHAHECELTSGQDLHRLSIRIDRIDQPTMDELRAFLQADLVSLAVVPEGMAFMTLEVSFR
jgi:hypothetical protein